MMNKHNFEINVNKNGYDLVQHKLKFKYLNSTEVNMSNNFDNNGSHTCGRASHSIANNLQDLIHSISESDAW